MVSSPRLRLHQLPIKDLRFNYFFSSQRHLLVDEAGHFLRHMVHLCRIPIFDGVNNTFLKVG